MQLLRRVFPQLFPWSSPVVGARIHGWKVVQPLGHSRNGPLYLVERAGRFSVLKWLSPSGLVRTVLARQELACLRGVTGPGFVKLEFHGRWPDKARGTPFLVLEHIPGLSLAQWCRKPGPTARDIARVFHALMGAVDELHQRGMCNPGLTCGDVVIREASHSPVMVDLSGVVAVGRRLTSQELVLDLHAVGAMLYEVLTHQHPGPGAPPPHVINPRVPRELSEYTMRLL